MNRIYRHVWNKAQGRYIVAAETASSGRGGRSATVTVGAVFAAMLTVLCVSDAYAQMVVAPGGNTVVYRSANGVQIVNIEAANQAGLSHNRYNNYNVEQAGVVLNNGNNSQLSRNSQLAGQVLHNPNLSAEARVILNEVVAPNRSTLLGFTEVLGSRADVVLANPWGITCAGCGFINTDRAVLSTGTPQFGPSGNLTEFRTIGGDILIEGAGMDATSTRAIDLVARSIRVNGQISAADLGITVGASKWNYENRTAEVIDAGDKPLYALDSTRLGGMYANRIAIVATEAGVGVRMMGDVAASADDFQMDANGRVEILGRVSAARDLRVRQWGTQGDDAFQVSGTDASLTAGKAMHVMASDGLVLTDATIKAEGDMTVSAQQLIDRAGSQANGARAASGNLNLDVAKTATMNNTSWSAQQALNIKAGTIGIGADGATLAAGANAGAADRALAVVASTGDIDLSGANIAGAQDVRITSQKGAVRVGKGSAQSVAAGRDLAITAATKLDNAGTIGAARDLTVAAADATASLAVVNRGIVQSDGKTTIAGNGGKNNLTLDNQAGASIATGGALSVTGTQLDNTGIIQSGDAVALTVSGKVVNAATGQVLGQGAGSVVKVDAGSLDNAGVVQSKGAIAATIAGAVTQVATGAIQTLGADQGGSGWGLELSGQTIDNQGTISSGGQLTAKAATTLDNSGIVQSKGAMALNAGTKLTQTKAGQILSADTASVQTAALDNSGRIQATKGLTIGANKARTQVDNHADGVISADALDAWVMNYINTGTTQAETKTSIDASGRIDNVAGATLTASLDGAGPSVLNAAGGITNAGTLNSVGELRVSGADVENTGKIAGKRAMVFTAAQKFVNETSIQSERGISVGAATALNRGNIAAADGVAMTVADSIDNRGTMHGGYVALVSTSLENYGDIKSASTVDIKTTETAKNARNILADAWLSLDAGTLQNDGTIQAATDATLIGNRSASNSGMIHGGANTTLSTITLNNSGEIKANAATTVSATQSVYNSGKLLSGTALDITTNSLANTQSGGIIAGSNLRAGSTTGVMDLTNAGTVQSTEAMTLGDATQRVALDNRAGGKIQAGSLALYGTTVTNGAGSRIQWMREGVIDADSVTNATSTSVIVGSLDDTDGVQTSRITLTGALTNQGALHSSGDLVVKAASVSNSNTAGISALNDMTMTASTGGIRNEGALYAGRDMTLTASNGLLINANDEATMDAERDIKLVARDITNQHSIQARNIDIQASNRFVNQPAGVLPTRYLDEAAPLSDVEKTILAEEWGCTLGAGCDFLDIYERVKVIREKLTFELPVFKPQILAQQTLSVSWGAGGGTNTAGVLSAQTINLSGSGAFVNEDFHLDDYTFASRIAKYTDNPIIGARDYYYYYPKNESEFNAPPYADDGVRWPGVVWGSAPNDYRQLRDQTTYKLSGAGIFAVNLNFTGGALVNRGAPKTIATAVKNVAGSGVETVTIGGVGSVGSTGGVGGIAGVGQSALAGVKAAAGLSLNGVVIKLPTNPNGYYVPSKNPGTKYLIETNPLFQQATSYLPSDYLAKELGLDPETTIKRLGDSNYEAYLVRQQLIGQTGKNLLNQKESEAQQLQRLYDNAASTAKGLGLTYGQPLSPAQLAGLKEDIVWMVETVVNGEKVLAPVVYLAPTTLAAVNLGTSMVAENTTIDADSVTNTGATLGGTSTLAVTSKGDITNTSGTITGGNVNLKSTEGSIVNQTMATTAGDSLTASTSIGNTAGIVATGTLNMDAKDDIKIIGANVTAKDATIAAGGDITVDTIVDKTVTSQGQRSSGLLSTSSSNQTIATERNIGSQLNIGGDLALKSGGDTTIAGSDVKAGGNFSADTGGDFNVLARQDKTDVTTKTSSSGVGVGGGLYGSTTTTANDFTGTNKGSTLTVGGNATVNSQGTMTVQGSDVNIGGNADITAKEGIAILDGLDEKHSTSHTETTTFGKIGGNSAAEATASAASKAGAGRNAAAEASASASGSVKLMEKTTTDSASGSTTSVASTFNVGGNANLKTDGNLTVQGSDVKAGGDLSIDANSVDVLTGRNTTYASTTSKSDSIGFYGEAGAKAGASAGTMGAMANAQAGAEAESTLTVGARTENASFSSGSTTNRGSTLSGGGNVTIKAKEDATFVGANVNAGGDLSVQATNIKSMAAQDTTYESSSADTKTAGLYISAGTSASASASNAGADASAGAEASAGLRYAQTAEGSSSGSVTQVTSSFTAGGNVNRNATGTITDQGTQIEAGGNINQTATEIKEVAAHNSSWETSNSSSLDARIGVYAGAEASASTTGGAGADASAGFKASVAGGTASSSESESTAVTSRYKAGGDINSTSTNGTTLIGTQFESGGNVNINAGSLDYQAARDTSSSSSSSLEGSAEAKVGILGTAGVNGSIEVEGGKESSSSSTARAGGINAGGTVNVNTKGNATFEGTNLNAGNGVNVGAGGNVNFNAATSTSESSGFSAGLSLSGGTSGSGKSRESEGAIGASASGTYSTSTNQVGSNISAGAGGVNISSGNNVNLQGTQVQTTGATTVSAGGTVNTSAAESSSLSVGAAVGIGAGVKTGGDNGSGKGVGGAGIGFEAGGSSSSQNVNIQSGGGTRVINNAPAASTVAAPAVAAPATSIQLAPTTSSGSGGRQIAPAVSRDVSAGMVVAPSVAAPAAPAVVAPATSIQLAPTTSSGSGGRQVSPTVSSGAAGGIRAATSVAAPVGNTAIAPAPVAPAAPAPAVVAPATTGASLNVAPTPNGGRQVAAPAPTLNRASLAVQAN